MKFTSEKLLKFFGLKVGDKIKVNGYFYPFVIIEENGKIFAKSENCLSSRDFCGVGALTNILLNNEYEVVKPKKKLGEMKCGEMSCSECPFISFDCSEWRLNSTNVLKSIPKATLYEVLEGFMTIYNFEKIIEELDKDV